MSTADLTLPGRADLLVVAETTSTNDEARDWIERGAHDGATIVADYQTLGRGRAGRTWHAPRGTNLNLSQVFYAPPESLRLVPLLGALATRDAVASFLPPVVTPAIKWPNDIQVLGFKVAGILSEWVDRESPAALLGIGVNLNMNPAQLPGDLRRPAASLRILGGKKVNRAEFLREMLYQLERWRTCWLRTPRKLVAEFAGRCSTLGKRVRVTIPGKEAFDAVACGIDPLGVLLVENEQGNTLPIEAGDVDPL